MQLEESGCFHSLAAAPGADSPAFRYSNLDVWESCWEQPAPTGGTRGALRHVKSQPWGLLDARGLLTGTCASEEPGTQPPRSISLLRSPPVPRHGEQPQHTRPEPTHGHCHHRSQGRPDAALATTNSAPLMSEAGIPASGLPDLFTENRELVRSVSPARTPSFSFRVFASVYQM